MARKRFYFDFNEDAEPCEELHRLRVAMLEHFKTVEAFGEYLRSTPTAKEILAQWDAEEKKAKPKTAVRRRTKPAAKPRGKRQPTAKAAHA